MANEIIEKFVETNFEKVMVELGDIEEIQAVFKEFDANYNLIKSILPQRYHINLLQLESTMMHMRISGEEHAYRAGLYDSLKLGGVCKCKTENKFAN